MQGYDITKARPAVENAKLLLDAAREMGMNIYHTRAGHRRDLSTVSIQEMTRSCNDPTVLGIGDEGPLGRLLIRGEPGHEIVSELEPREGEPIVDKPAKSAFAYTDLELLLRIRQIKNVILCGATTEVCVHTTARDACDKAFDVLVVEDACHSGLESTANASVDMIKLEGGIFGTIAQTKAVLELLDNQLQSRNGSR